ncbi:DNA mismatch repair protein MutS [Spirosoma sp.]|uniref:MutS-related protein n=1 Tax=Spirosoma sp. TaxID=1899569 RepID=UPI0026366D3B|nr:DNA mismatch repair protein MutS [Spirosoma sp.]MCX6212853.1 DNA mismatch repair protein MutS [Spirosoma sp.]
MTHSKQGSVDSVNTNAQSLKQEPFDWLKIERFFRLTDLTGAYQVISDRTFQDLDLDEVFMFIDRTRSRIGQQFLYYTLRTIPNHPITAQQLEKTIAHIREDVTLKETIERELAPLNSTNSYSIASLFLREPIQKPGWFWAIKSLSVVSLLIGLVGIAFHQAWLLLLPLLTINYLIHYWNKNNLYAYAGSIPQLTRMNQAAKVIHQHQRMREVMPEVGQAIKAIDQLGPQTSFFKIEAKLQSEIGLIADYFLELLKALFLLEPLIFYQVLQQIALKRAQIQSVYQYVGLIDVALSLHDLRQELPYYCQPTLTPDLKQLTFQDAYHPLIDQAVANSIHLAGQSALLTGSNMSGKTTFVRTVGINALLAQTLNTCFARYWQMPLLNIHSAIRISDDLLSAKSYYFEEVLTLKTLLEASQSAGHHLFLLDELFKGTNTVERIAASKAVLSYLNQPTTFVFVATHDLELAQLLTGAFELYHFTEVVQRDTILFDYKLKPGILTGTNAIRILELNQYPLAVTQEATRLAQHFYQIKTKPDVN